MQRSSPIRFIAFCLASAVLAVVLLALGGCGAATRDDSEPPLIGIDGLNRDGDRVTLVLSLRNLNPTPQRFDPSLLQLRLDEAVLLNWTQPGGTELGIRGRESLSLTGPAELAGLEALDRLSEGVRNLAWALEVTMIDPRGREQVVEASGFLHRVPGRVDQFR